MSAAVPYSLKTLGTTATTSVASFTAPSLGDTLLAMIAIPTANAPATSIIDSTGYNYLSSPDLVVSALNGYTFYFVRRSNIAESAPNSISITGTTGSFAATIEVARVTGMVSTSPVESTFNTVLPAGVPTYSKTHTYTTSHSNAFIWLGTSTSNGRNLNSASNGFSVVLPESGGSIPHVAYKADAGAIGTYSTDLVFNSATICTAIGVIYKLTDSPTVVSNPDVSVVEGNLSTHTVTLSTTTTVTESYPVTLVASGTYPASGGGVDFNSSLSNATFGGSGVTYSAGNLIVPSGILSFPVVISTSSDLLDEYDKTYTLTVGGVSSIATILDNNPVQSFITSNVASSVNAGYPLVFNYTVRPISGKDITAELTLTPDTAIAGTHYTTPVTSGMFNNGVTISGSTVTIPAGTSSFTLTIPTIL